MNLFVYGTLRRDGPSGPLLARFKRFRGEVHGQLFRMPAGYPALVLGGAGTVEGEYVEAVDSGTLAMIDLYEGVADGLYERVSCEVRIALRWHAAQVYVMRDPQARGGVPIDRWRNVVRR